MNAPSAQKLRDKTLKQRQRRPDRLVAWALGVLLTAVVVGLWAWSRFVRGEQTGGDTVAGYALGGITVVLYAVVAAYSIRRSYRRQKRMMLRSWMELHIVLGVVAGLAALLHSGPKLGAPIHGAFLIAWLLLVGTGILGKWMYRTVPKKLTALEEEELLVEDVIDKQRALRTEVEELLESASAQIQELADREIPKAIKSPMAYAKKRMQHADVVEAIYEQLGGDTAVAQDDRELLQRIIYCQVEDRFLDAIFRQHRLMRFWLPTHIALTTLCIPWLLFHVVTVFLF